MIKYKIYIELDNNNCIHKMLSTAFYAEEELEERKAIYIDEVSLEEGSNTTNGQYLQNNYFVDKYGKNVLDSNGNPNFRYVSEKIQELTEEEKEELFIKPQEINAEKERQQKKLEDMMKQAQQVAFLVELPDEQSATIPYCYPKWDSYIGKPLTKLNEQGKENRIEYNGELWKVRNDIPVVLENQAPGIETAALYERIDVEHAGTLEDPIPYDQTMTVYKDKYYIENEKIYKCIRDSGQPLYATCESLVGNYFELV